jgi:hypothetical protein
MVNWTVLTMMFRGSANCDDLWRVEGARAVIPALHGKQMGAHTLTTNAARPREGHVGSFSEDRGSRGGYSSHRREAGYIGEEDLRA